MVGQEYGRKDELVKLEDRHEMIVNWAGHDQRFKAQDGYAVRNPHMKGCTSLLRLILGLGLGADYDGEFVDGRLALSLRPQPGISQRSYRDDRRTQHV